MTTGSAIDELRQFVAECAGVPAETITDRTCLVGDLRFLAPDLDELVEEFAERFAVDCSSYLWFHHASPDGFNPL